MLKYNTIPCSLFWCCHLKSYTINYNRDKTIPVADIPLAIVYSSFFIGTNQVQLQIGFLFQPRTKFDKKEDKKEESVISMIKYHKEKENVPLKPGLIVSVLMINNVLMRMVWQLQNYMV